MFNVGSLKNVLNLYSSPSQTNRSEAEKMTTNSTRPRQNFSAESEAALNRQINLELYASHVYLSMASHFERDDVALPGFAKFFYHNSHEEREHAEKLIRYQNKRGGRCKYSAVEKPEKDEWGTGLDAIRCALDLEKKVNQALLELHAIATKNNDVTLADFLESEMLNEQVDAIKELSDYCTQLERVGTGLGEYIFDRETLKGEDSDLTKK